MNLNPRLESKYRRELRTLKARKRRNIRKAWARINPLLTRMSSVFVQAGESIKLSEQALSMLNSAYESLSKRLKDRSPCPYQARFGSSECGAHICPDGIIDECEAYENWKTREKADLEKGYDAVCKSGANLFNTGN